MASAQLTVEDADFLSQLRAGDEAAFRLLVTRHHAALVRLARSFCKVEATAEEVVQDAWLAVVQGLDGYAGDASLRTWIAAIVINKAKTRAVRDSRVRSFSEFQAHSDGGDDTGLDLDRFAASGAWLDPPGFWNSITPERVFSGRQLVEHLAQALDRLPANQRAAVLLRDVQGLDTAEVCLALSITDAHLRVLLHRARTRLRAVLEAIIAPVAKPAQTTARRTSR